jgi:hypothetical protein
VTWSRLSSPVTYEEGEVSFDPPNATYNAPVSAAQAYSSWLSSGDFTDAPQYSQPLIQLADYSDYGNGPIQSDGSIDPTWVGQPAWVFTFTNVPFQPTGGAVLPGQTYTNPPVVKEDEVVIINANTGGSLGVMIAMPDPTPQPPRS